MKMTFIQWSISKKYRTMHEEGGVKMETAHYLVYDDESYVILQTNSKNKPTYLVQLGNCEREFSTCYDAERYLWDNHSRFNYEESWRIHGFCQIEYRSTEGKTRFTVRDFDHTVTGEEWEGIKKLGPHNTITCVPPESYPDDIEDLIDLKYITLNTERV